MEAKRSSRPQTPGRLSAAGSGLGGLPFTPLHARMQQVIAQNEGLRMNSLLPGSETVQTPKSMQSGFQPGTMNAANLFPLTSLSGSMITGHDGNQSHRTTPGLPQSSSLFAGPMSAGATPGIGPAGSIIPGPAGSIIPGSGSANSVDPTLQSFGWYMTSLKAKHNEGLGSYSQQVEALRADASECAESEGAFRSDIRKRHMDIGARIAAADNRTNQLSSESTRLTEECTVAVDKQLTTLSVLLRKFDDESASLASLKEKFSADTTALLTEVNTVNAGLSAGRDALIDARNHAEILRDRTQNRLDQVANLLKQMEDLAAANVTDGSMAVIGKELANLDSWLGSIRTEYKSFANQLGFVTSKLNNKIRTVQANNITRFGVSSTQGR